jgi:hypothetical protein
VGAQDFHGEVRGKHAETPGTTGRHVDVDLTCVQINLAPARLHAEGRVRGIGDVRSSRVDRAGHLRLHRNGTLFAHRHLARSMGIVPASRAYGRVVPAAHCQQHKRDADGRSGGQQQRQEAPGLAPHSVLLLGQAGQVTQHTRACIRWQPLRRLLPKLLHQEPARLLGATGSAHRQMLLEAKPVCVARLPAHRGDYGVAHLAARGHDVPSRRRPNKDSAI